MNFDIHDIHIFAHCFGKKIHKVLAIVFCFFSLLIPSVIFSADLYSCRLWLFSARQKHTVCHGLCR